MSRSRSSAALTGLLIIGPILTSCGSTPGQSASHTHPVSHDARPSGDQRALGSATVGEVIRIEILGAT